MFFKHLGNNLHKRLIYIAIPIIIQNLVLYLQIQIDMAMVGQANSLFLSAIANVLYPYNIVIAFLTSLSTGATVVSSHCIGAKSLNSAQRYSEVSFFFNFILAVPFFLILYLLPSTLLTLMGTTAQINEYGTIFLQSLSFSVICLGVSLSITSLLMGMGKTKHLMLSSVVTTAINIFFDWALIYGNLGFPEWGIQGAGIATSIANFTGMMYLIIALITSKNLHYKPSLKGILKPRWHIQWRSIVVGLPFGLEAMFWSLGQIIMVRMINGVDEYAAGLYVLITRIQSVTFFFYLGLARATMTLVGQEMGANNREGAFYVVSLSLKYAFSICVLASITFLLFPDSLLSIFSSDHDLINRALPLLNIVALTIFPVAVNVISGNALRGMKDTKWMFYTQSFGTAFVIVVSATLLFNFNLGLKGVIITVLCDEIIRAILNYRRFRNNVSVQISHAY
ncbi:MAG: MATE family efflux transporter [Cyclobacteriaceae bacterium]